MKKTKFVPWTKEQKTEFGKQFTAKERKAYQKGKRNGFLNGVHTSKRVNAGNFSQRTYSQQDHDKLFESLGSVKI